MVIRLQLSVLGQTFKIVLSASSFDEISVNNCIDHMQSAFNR